jgi:hypothetical protein
VALQDVADSGDAAVLIDAELQMQEGAPDEQAEEDVEEGEGEDEGAVERKGGSRRLLASGGVRVLPSRRRGAAIGSDGLRKEFSFEDNSVRTVMRGSQSSPPAAAPPVEAAHRRWQRKSSPEVMALRQRQQIGRPEVQAQELSTWGLAPPDNSAAGRGGSAVRSVGYDGQPLTSDAPREMIKAFRSVSMTVGAFNPDGTARNLKGVEKQLSACFRYLEKCETPPETVADNMGRLESVRRLERTTIRCPTAHSEDPSCAKLVGNPEFGGTLPDPKAHAPEWLAPLERHAEGLRHVSCAVVGNSADLSASDFHGAAIDAHEAVFRINLAPTVTYEPYVGNRTTYRVLDAATIEVRPCAAC